MVRSELCLETAYPFLLTLHYRLLAPGLLWRIFAKIGNLGHCSLIPRFFGLTQGNLMSPFVCCRYRPSFIGLALFVGSLTVLAVFSPRRDARDEADHKGVEAVHGIVVS